MATLMVNERASYIVILSYLPLPVFRPRPVEFGRQPPEGVRTFQWLQYSMVCLCCEVGMACFGVEFSGMEFSGMELWQEGLLVADVPLLALHSEGPGKRLTLWMGCGMLGKKEGPAPGSSPLLELNRQNGFVALLAVFSTLCP